MRFLAAALIFFGVAASSAQTPEVPHKIRFAGMSLTIRDDARREIQKDVEALTRHSGYFDLKAERARTYFPVIEKIFAEENLPDDFKYLCLQESALVPDAVSVSNAVGFWQFKDFTAQEMGLRVDREVDERMNIVSASRAAARYLKQSNSYFNNWLLSLQSYQMGAGGVKRSVGDRYNGDNHMVISASTYWYVKKYLAHKIAFENACTGDPKLKIVLYETTNRKFNEIANELSVDEETLKEYNKWSKRGLVPDDKRYAVIVPGNTTVRDFNSLVINSKKAKKAYVIPKAMRAAQASVQINGVDAVAALEGETAATLAARLGLDVSTFLRYNDISIDEEIKPGKFYFLKRKKRKNELPIYRAKLGDDLWAVSQKFGVRLSNLRKLNPSITPALLTAGASIRLNKKAPLDLAIIPSEGESVAMLSSETFSWAEQPSHSAESIQVQPLPRDSLSKMDSISYKGSDSVIYHTVETHETLYSIAKKYSLSISQLREDNQLSDSTMLKLGQTLLIRSPKLESFTSGTVLADAQHDGSSLIYTVKEADTLYSISRQFGATIKEVMDWNHKSVFTVTPGEKLKIQKR